jgi:hypothetical protein
MNTQKEILRPMFDNRSMLWKIVKKTSNGCGGWKSFGSGSVYISKQSCQDKIDWLVDHNPELYQSDN